MSRPARAKPTLSLRWSIDVEPSWRPHDELHGLEGEVVVIVVPGAAAGQDGGGVGRRRSPGPLRRR